MRKRKRKVGSVKKTPKKIVKRKKRTAKKPKVPRPLNAGTQSTAMFWGMIRAALRRVSMIRWLPTREVRQKARVPYVGPNKKRKYSYVCEMCSAEVDAKNSSVHHKVPCGSLTCSADVEGFVTRLFCEKEGLMLICNKCHDKIHEK